MLSWMHNQITFRERQDCGGMHSVSSFCAGVYSDCPELMKAASILLVVQVQQLISFTKTIFAECLQS